jgi:hypothetical protein
MALSVHITLVSVSKGECNVNQGQDSVFAYGMVKKCSRKICVVICRVILQLATKNSDDAYKRLAGLCQHQNWNCCRQQCGI